MSYQLSHLMLDSLSRTISGVGEKLAATLVAELGDIQQFENPKQLVWPMPEWIRGCFREIYIIQQPNYQEGL